ncbi:MAG TPA: hypothetical protein ENI77_01830 [Nitrospirae bacterium]|nr:hypothetical protein [Nitrospirota bacterium]
MIKRNSKLLVIDATVFQAAGGKKGSNQTSSFCSRFLMEVYVICHRAVLTSECNKEWNDHYSHYSIKWKSKMMGARKVDLRHDEEVMNSELRDTIEKHASSESKRIAMLKDAHLIEAALNSDKIVISLDDKAKNNFSEIAGKFRELKSIVWINPVQEKDKAIQWLEEGAKPYKTWQLGST